MLDTYLISKLSLKVTGDRETDFNLGNHHTRALIQ